MEREEVLNIFRKCGALLTGHFRLSSGLHSDTYLQCAKVLQYPKLAESLCRELARRLPAGKIDASVGPAMGGITFAYELARALGTRALFAERQDGRMTLRRGFGIVPGERVLIAEDVVTTGKSVGEVIDLVRQEKAEVVGVACLINRGGAASLGVECVSLAEVEAKSYREEECPLCKKGVELETPGSRHINRQVKE